MQRPMARMLRAASGRMSLHMPGHQGKAPFGEMPAYRWDTTELPVTDDLYHAKGAIARAEELAAKSARAAATLMLHDGSTAGNQTMLLYAARRGEKVILPRNAHISCLNACALYGIEPVFAAPELTADGRVLTTVESYALAMEAHPDAKAVLAVCPDFYGVRMDMTALSTLAHSRGMLCLCDEAHGAHFNWARGERTALCCGADMAVQSAHKTLPALTGSAWLHLNAGVDAARARRLLRMAQTSSPSFLLLASLDDARAWMDAHGAKAYERLAGEVKDFLSRAGSLGYQNGNAGLCADPTRLVLSAPQGGFALEKQLAERGMDVEMSDERRVVCILSLRDGGRRLKRLYRALRTIPAREAENRAPYARLPAIAPRAASAGEATTAPCEATAMARAAGRVSAASVGLYPPGVAVLCAGERITPEIVEYLTAQLPQRLFGVTERGELWTMTKENANGEQSAL